MKETINIIGLGYIGLPTALILAKYGNNVTGTDYNLEIVEKLNNGVVNFEENGIQSLMTEALNNNIKFTTDYIKTNFYIVAVPTPYISETKEIDASYLISAVKTIIKVCDIDTTIVIESTIPPSTIDHKIRPIINSVNKKIDIAHAPERIIPGNMIYELENNARTIGADDLNVAEKVKAIYSTFCKGEFILTDIRSAEMSKVVENTYRDINIAFANELAKICRTDNLDAYEIIKIANMHPRVNILSPGPGVGGHCISVDPWFLVGNYPCDTDLIRTARSINDSMPEFVIKRITDIMKEKNIQDFSKVGLYGLSYKENVDDTRESPTLQLLSKLDEKQRKDISVYDPLVNKKLSDNQKFSLESFLDGIDLLVIMVGHNQIRELENSLKDKMILDTKNVFSKSVYKL